MIGRWRSQPLRSRVVAAATGVVVLAVAGWLAARDRGGDWVAVRRADLPLAVEVVGTLKAVESDLLGPPQVREVWEFKISFLAPEGSKVKRGQPVLGFDTSALERERETKVAERDTAAKEIEKKRGELELAEHDDALRVAEAEARLRKAALKVERPEDVVASKELAKARLDLALAEREVAYLKEKTSMSGRAAASELAALSRAHDLSSARVAEINDAIARMTVVSRRDGTLTHTADWRGDKRKVGDTVWRGFKVVEVPDLSAMTAKGEVDEADAGKLAAGKAVRLRLDAHPDIEFTGTVATVARSAERKTSANPLKVVKLDVALERTDEERMRPGMRFRGEVEVGRVRDVLVVPLDAVFPTPAGPVVYRRTLTGVAATPVQTGERSSELVQILSGLAAGDQVSRRVQGHGGGR